MMLEVYGFEKYGRGDLGSAAADGVSGRRARVFFADRLLTGRRCISRSRCRASAALHTLFMSFFMLDR
jgi:hypothetical protein